jgi:hypothetical protein
MPQYLVSMYLPDNFDPSTQNEAMADEIHALNKEMIAAGVRKFACGLGSTRTLRAQPNGDVLSPTVPTWKPRSTWAACPFWNAPTLKRRWPGRARAQRLVACRWRCGRSSSCRPPRRAERCGNGERAPGGGARLATS